jgi:DNA repair protein RAD5
MSLADMGEPPNKKRRFFTEKSDVLDSSLAPEACLPDEIDACVPSADTAVEQTNGAAADGLQNDNKMRIDALEKENGIPGFDRETFESFVGDKVAPDVLKRLREASGDNMERAVNMYFDGSWKNAALPPRKHSSMTINGFASSHSSGNAESSTAPRAEDPQPVLIDAMPDFRYVGAFGVGGWATRSGKNLIKHGEPVRIERQKIQPPKALASSCASA